MSMSKLSKAPWCSNQRAGSPGRGARDVIGRAGKGTCERGQVLRKWAAALMCMLLGLSFQLGCAGPKNQKFRPSVGMRQRGNASYYTDRLTGRPTASGEPYSPRKLTAAHRKLPLGTRVRVHRLDGRRQRTGRSVDVKVNDRGPFRPDLIIDLSRVAATQLDMIRKGVVPVEIEVSPSRRHEKSENAVACADEGLPASTQTRSSWALFGVLEPP